MVRLCNPVRVFCVCVCECARTCVEPLGVVFGSNSVRWYEGQLAADAHIFLLKKHCSLYNQTRPETHAAGKHCVCMCVRVCVPEHRLSSNMT